MPTGHLYTPKSKAPHRGPVLGRGACLSPWPWELRVVFGPLAHRLSAPCSPGPLKPMADATLTGCVGLAQAGHVHGSQRPVPLGGLLLRVWAVPLFRRVRPEEGVCPQEAVLTASPTARASQPPRGHADPPAPPGVSPAAVCSSSLEPSLTDTWCSPRTRSHFLTRKQPLRQDEFTPQG